MVVPSPKFPVAELKTNGDCPRSPKRMVDDAWSPFDKRRVVEVEFTTLPKFVASVNGKA